jgi:Glycosyl transferase family 2
VRGAIDHPADGAQLSPGLLRVRGWLLDDAGALEDAVLLVDKEVVARPRLGVARPDVAAAFRSVPHAISSGFECDVELRAGSGSRLRIDLLARTAAAGWQAAGAIEVSLSPGGEDHGSGRPRAAFTIVQNEPVMLPLWLDYYGRYFDAEDLYVLDHGTSDGSTSQLEGRCRVVPVHRTTSFDHRWLRGTVEAFQSFLLRSYETVLFAEADEFIVADPLRFRGLGEYINALKGPAARCVGFNVVHQPDEPPIRFDAPLLAQRRYWRASLDCAKRLIAKVPLRWSEGFHVEYSAPDDPPDPALMLVHLHCIDYEWCLERHKSNAARNWSRDDLASGAAAHNRLIAEEEFERWFREGRDLGGPSELIPEHVRGVL